MLLCLQDGVPEAAFRSLGNSMPHTQVSFVYHCQTSVTTSASAGGQAEGGGQGEGVYPLHPLGDRANELLHVH